MHRTPGEGRYAQIEREQRWLVAALPDGLSDPSSIVDRYLDETRLRLRFVTAGGAATYKLGQKVRPEPAIPMLDDRFSGGRLAELEPADAARLLDDVTVLLGR